MIVNVKPKKILKNRTCRTTTAAWSCYWASLSVQPFCFLKFSVHLEQCELPLWSHPSDPVRSIQDEVHSETFHVLIVLGSNTLPPLADEENLVPNRSALLLFISRLQCPWGVSILQLQSGPDIYSWPQLLLSDWQLHQGPRLHTKPFQAAYML